MQLGIIERPTAVFNVLLPDHVRRLPADDSRLDCRKPDYWTMCLIFWWWFCISMMQKFDWRLNYDQKSNLKMAAIRHLWFLKIWFWPLGLLRLLIFYRGTKFGAKCWSTPKLQPKIKIQDGGRPPSAILEFLYHHPRSHCVGIHQPVKFYANPIYSWLGGLLVERWTIVS